VQVQLMPRPQWFEFVRSYQHHLCESAGTNYDPDELRLRFTTPLIGSINYANCSDATLDTLLERGARQPLGSPTRRQTYEAAQRRMLELVPAIPILTMVRTIAISKRVHDLTMGPAATSAIALSDTWLSG
jgi:ABC-type transport system substrate-binding protein